MITIENEGLKSPSLDPGSVIHLAGSVIHLTLEVLSKWCLML